jgi:DNA repair protein RecO (recombination protein O)
MMNPRCAVLVITIDMKVLGQTAFVLHARPWRETSFIVEILTRDYGRVAVIARGVTGPKKHSLRAALQPMQQIRIDYQLQGEMGRMVQAEAIDVPPRLHADSLLASFYINELLIKLLPRQDAANDIFDLYAIVRQRLYDQAPLAWTLRRFERDLLDAVGVGFAFDTTHDGQACDPAARYRLDAEHGPIRDPHHGQNSISGAALIALASDQMPAPHLLQECRIALKYLISQQLGNVELKSWSLLSELAQFKAAGRSA